MSRTVVLKNAIGTRVSYTVENGIKISDGNGGFVSFYLGGGTYRAYMEMLPEQTLMM